MKKWNALEIRKLFEEKAKENGCSLTKFLKQFVSEMEGETRIDSTTLNRYLQEGSKGPKKGPIIRALYEKIEQDFGYDMQGEDLKRSLQGEYSLEDTTERLPKFCQETLNFVFKNICSYIQDAYRGEHSFLFEKDCNFFLYQYFLCKPLIPNYVCADLQKLIEDSFLAIRKEVEQRGLLIFDGIGVMYKDEIEEGKEPNPDWCEEIEDYLNNNLEAHQDRIRRFFENIVTFWEKRVESLYLEGGGIAKEMREQFRELQKE